MLALPRDTPLPRTPAADATLVAYGLLSLTNVVAVGAGASGLSNVTQWLLIPTLAAGFLLLPPRGPAPLPRLRTATLTGLAFSWLGDVLPDLVPSGVSFLAMVGAFLCAQVAFSVGFWPMRGESLLRRPAVLGYAVVYLALMAACLPGAGSLRVPVLVYGLVLTTMAVLATGVGLRTGVGGLVFMLSDALIALGEFRHWDSRPLSVAVMATYAVAEVLLVMGVQGRRAASVGGPPG